MELNDLYKNNYKTTEIDVESEVIGVAEFESRINHSG